MLATALLCVPFLTGCGGDQLSLSEYSTEVAELVQEFDARLDAEAQEYFSGPPDVEAAQEYVRIRVAGYRDVVERTNAIDPPETVQELHATFREIMGKLLIAEEARAAFAETVTSTDELDLVWEGPEVRAIRAVEEEAIVLCYAAQSRFDATEQREALEDIPWMPSELKEVVRVALDCP